MHFSKTYTQLLLSLPPELRDNAIQYRQLKKIINQIVSELDSHGLKPALLHELIDSSESASVPEPDPEHHDSCAENDDSTEDTIKFSQPRVVYELNATSGKIEPRLRIWISTPRVGAVPPLRPPVTKRSSDDLESVSEADSEEAPEEGRHGEESDLSVHTRLLWSFQQLHFGDEEGGVLNNAKQEEVDVLSREESLGLENGRADADTTSLVSPDVARAETTSAYQMQEVVIPLVHDSEFFNMLSTTLESISTHLSKMHEEFLSNLSELSRSIADSSHPASVAAGFHPSSSVTTHAGAVRVRSGELKSDLYFWREIFRLYVEAEVFESMGEASRGEWSVEESEKRLQIFAQRVTSQGLGDHRKFKKKQSLQALESFLNLNLFILNVKKFSFANSEATRKILKKHTKRTALFYPGFQSASTASGAPQSLLALVPHSSPFSFPRLLVQAVGETLLPIIPSLEDYSCLICTSIAFKPIRLSCGHLFCVRCLVKMQKRRKDNCPMCRSPSVLVANRSNVDWALLNFMQDWFPLESREKLKSNEKEAAEEELRELGIDPNQSCTVM
ncbi:hypothetical protein CPC08DRAFT_744734 [Agrocybe pediades]|nr:hypothetical protein CPC08DRAFT_744734 [Agrocybe pediades]